MVKHKQPDTPPAACFHTGGLTSYKPVMPEKQAGYRPNGIHIARTGKQLCGRQENSLSIETARLALGAYSTSGVELFAA